MKNIHFLILWYSGFILLPCSSLAEAIYKMRGYVSSITPTAITITQKENNTSNRQVTLTRSVLPKSLESLLTLSSAQEPTQAKWLFIHSKWIAKPNRR